MIRAVSPTVVPQAETIIVDLGHPDGQQVRWMMPYESMDLRWIPLWDFITERQAQMFKTRQLRVLAGQAFNMNRPLAISSLCWSVTIGFRF